MFGFGEVFNRKPRQFKYTPRYYDPEKEARDKRRAELGLDVQSDKPMQPGDRLRERRMAHAAEFSRTAQTRRKRNTMLIAFIMLLVFGMLWLLLSI